MEHDMARPSLPSKGQEDWSDQLNAAINEVSDKADAAQAMPGCVYLDSFPGSTDDAKLAAALTFAKAQPYKPAIIFGNRRYDFTQPIDVYSGMRLQGGAPGSTEQVRSGNPIPGAIHLNIGGNRGWLRFPNGNVFGVNIGGLSFNGNSSTRWADVNTASNVVTSVFEDLSFTGFLSIFGSTTSIHAFTISTFRGFWNINNGRDLQFNIGGSDCSFWETGSVNLDSPTGYRPDGSYLLSFTSMSKTTVGPVYLTAERSAGLRIQNSASGQLIIRSMRIEGRNAGVPCYGAVVRVSGNNGVTFRDCWFAYGMSNPALTGRDDQGVIHVTSGDVDLQGAWYGVADGVSRSIPFLYASGGKVRIRDTHTQPTQNWTTKPVVVQAGTAIIDADNSVTVIDGNGNVLQP